MVFKVPFFVLWRGSTLPSPPRPSHDAVTSSTVFPLILDSAQPKLKNSMPDPKPLSSAADFTHHPAERWHHDSKRRSTSCTVHTSHVQVFISLRPVSKEPLAATRPPDRSQRPSMLAPIPPHRPSPRPAMCACRAPGCYTIMSTIIQHRP